MVPRWLLQLSSRKGAPGSDGNHDCHSRCGSSGTPPHPAPGGRQPRRPPGTSRFPRGHARRPIRRASRPWHRQGMRPHRRRNDHSLLPPRPRDQFGVWRWTAAGYSRGDIVVGTEILELGKDQGDQITWSTTHKSLRPTRIRWDDNSEVRVHYGKILTTDEMVLRAANKGGSAGPPAPWPLTWKPAPLRPLRSPKDRFPCRPRNH